MMKLLSVSEVKLGHDGLSVYEHILSAEQAAMDKGTQSAAKYTYQDDVIGARVLGFLLLDLWQHQKHYFGLTPYLNLVKTISSCLRTAKGSEDAHKAWCMLGLSYRNHLMRVFRSDGGPVPNVSQLTSRPSMQQIRQKIIEEMQTPTTNEDAWKHALLRDGYRCTLTGIYDYDSCQEMPDLDAECATSNATQSNVQCAHIFSESALDGDKVTDYTASAMALLRMFGLTNEAEILVGGNVNRHFNIFLVVDGLHYFYNCLEFWLEEVFGEEPNTYDLCAANPTFFARQATPPHRRITFEVDPKVVADCEKQNKPVPALPSPSLLAIRAACSRVAHRAGAVEQADQILRDLEEISVMAEDGGTAELLTSRLLQFPSVRVGLSSP
ncbi:hypothetical protein C8F01DRAFT_973337 [Mycena amicta]|nr:hypothetical protein C8F01DRAFT_973337 [Mycena amicta]